MIVQSALLCLSLPGLSEFEDKHRWIRETRHPGPLRLEKSCCFCKNKGMLLTWSWRNGGARIHPRRSYAGICAQDGMNTLQCRRDGREQIGSCISAQVAAPPDHSGLLVVVSGWPTE
ncbi:hypothetical protein LIA77_04759 [Sarocladium implicatum]|nr:hypothetical protein LIA77_04759 [Sarocladium implicatum]